MNSNIIVSLPALSGNVDERLFANLEIFEASLKAHLLAARVLHFDETGMRCEKKLHWVHVASSQMATFYQMPPTKEGVSELLQIFFVLAICVRGFYGPLLGKS